MKTTTPKKNITMKNSILFAAALLLAPCALLADVDWTAYAKSIDISFPGYTGATTLTDFPVLVRLSAARNKFDYSKCAVNGYDLRFSDAEGNLLSHEIDTWDTTGESLVWVKVPSFDASTKITAHYGYKGAGQPPAVTASDVWSADYVGVWHLGESSLPMKESSGVSTDFSGATNTVVYGADGVVGGAVDFSTTADNNYLVAENDDDLNGLNDFTVEIWTYQNAFRTDSSYAALFAKRNGGYSQESFFAYEDNSGSTRRRAFCFNTVSASNTRSTIWGSPASVGQWNYYAYTRTAETGSLTVYKDGISNATATTSLRGSAFSGNATLKLGGGGGQQAFPGKIDEFRISKTVRSADWIKATNDCMTDKDFAMYDIGNDWAWYSHKFSVTFSGYEGSETLTNFPVLVKVSEGTPSGFSYADCLTANGGDLRFADADGKLLASEVDTWNSNGVSLVWVKVPTLTASTKITAYYGCEAAPSVNAASVWANGYVGVWHLGDADNQTQADSTTNHLDFLCHDKEVQNVDLAVSNGAVGGAVGFNKMGNDYGGLYLLDTESKLSGFMDCTIETWMCPTNDAKGSYFLVNETTSETGPFCLALSSGKSPRMMSQTEGMTKFDYPGAFDTSCTVGNWHHVAFARTGSTGSLGGYLDGVRDITKSTTVGRLVSSTGQVVLGNRGVTLVTWASDRYINHKYSFLGYLDEVRISQTSRSADWIKATSDCVTKANFATYSAAREVTRAAVLIFN